MCDASAINKDGRNAPDKMASIAFCLIFLSSLSQNVLAKNNREMTNKDWNAPEGTKKVTQLHAEVTVYRTTIRASLTRKCNNIIY